MPHKMPNQDELTGVTAAISNFAIGDSGQRSYMAWSQSQQAPKPREPDLPYVLTGYERQLADTTVAITMPCDALIIDVFSHYIKVGSKTEASKTIIYENNDNGKIGSIELDPYIRAHDVFGVRYILTAQGRSLRPKMMVPKGTILAATGELEKQGFYANSITANVANLTLAGTAEDGLIVSEEFLERCRPIAMAKRELSCGAGNYMVNTYGDSKDFKPCPGPGDQIRADKVLFATRKTDEWLDAVYMLEDMINTIDFVSDDCTYAPQEANGAHVTNLTVFSSASGSRLRHTPPTMEDFLKEHLRQKSDYSKKIVDCYRNLEKRYGKQLQLEGEFESTVTYAMGDSPNAHLSRNTNASGTVQYTHKNKQIDEWQMFIEISWLFELGYGAKLTTMHGCKGVVCEIRPEADMPIDAFGNRADVVQNAKAIEDRMIWGQLYEGYYASVLRDVQKDVEVMLKDNQWEAAYEHVMTIIELMAPGMYKHYRATKNTPEKIQSFLQHMVKTRFRIVKRSEESTDTPEIASKIRAYRAPDKSLVTYRNYDGRMITSEVPVLIQPLRILVLDKSSFKPMSAAVARRQHHGLPSTTNKRTKVSTPTHENPGRSLAEAENRNVGSSIGGEPLAYLLDFSANPDATKAVLRSMILSPSPFKVEKHLDRQKVPEGYGRPIQYFKNFLFCRGTEITHKGDNDQ